MRLTADPDPERAIAVLRRAVELGVDHIDTAAFYVSPGGTLGVGTGPKRYAADLIRRALAPYPDDLTITTKVGPQEDPETGAFSEATTKAELRAAVEENLRLLGRDHLDEARDIAPVVCVQNSYAVDNGRADDELVRTCAERGIAFVPFFALAGANREGGAVADHGDAVLTVARERGVTPHQVRLAWTLHQGPHVLAIPGTGDVAHLEQNIAAAALSLSVEELALLG